MGLCGKNERKSEGEKIEVKKKTSQNILARIKLN